MTKAKHDITHSCLGRVDCPGLCAICEIVLGYINSGVEYSEDGGENRYKKLAYPGGQYDFFFGTLGREWDRKRKQHRGIKLGGSGRRW